MADKQLNTVLILRNDDTSAWESSERVLMKGELALEYQEDGTVKMKAGNDTDKFSDLDYVGSDVKPAQVFQVELSENDTDDIGAIESYLQNLSIETGKTVSLSVGDIAIVKAGIAGNYKSYTSYVYDGDNWVATDGNYSASNVFFKNDITLAGDYTSIGNVKLSDGTLSAAGQSLENLITSIFTKELNSDLKTEDPTAAITSFTQYYEIGSNGSKSVTVSLNGDGSYAYGYSTDPTEPEEGVTVNTVKNDGSTGVVVDITKTNPYSVTFNNETQEASTSTFTLNAPVKTSKTELKAYSKVYYSKGGVPVSNLNKAYPSQRIAEGQATSSSSAVFRWYVPYYYGFIYGKENKLDTVDVSKLTKATDSVAYTANKKTSDAATDSWMQYWLVVPKSYNWVMKDAKDSNNLTLSASTAENITITYGTGDNAVDVEYNVYYIDNADPYDTKSISWSL